MDLEARLVAKAVAQSEYRSWSNRIVFGFPDQRCYGAARTSLCRRPLHRTGTEGAVAIDQSGDAKIPGKRGHYHNHSRGPLFLADSPSLPALRACRSGVLRPDFIQNPMAAAHRDKRRHPIHRAIRRESILARLPWRRLPGRVWADPPQLRAEHLNWNALEKLP
jgi:hypothetical protein